MNKVIGWVVFGFLCMVPASKGNANTLTDIWDGISAEPHQTIGESVLPIYAYDFNNGTTRIGAVTAFYRVGPFSADTGLLSPIDSRQTGTPVLGVSVHVDQLVKIVSPQINSLLRSLFPTSASKFLDAFILGVAPVHNFNTPENQSSLIAVVYSGLELKF